MVTSLSCRAPHYNAEFPVDLSQVHSAHKLLFSRDLLQQVFSNMYLRLFLNASLEEEPFLTDRFMVSHYSWLIIYPFSFSTHISTAATWWSNLHIIQVAPPGGQIQVVAPDDQMCNQFKHRHLVAEFETTNCHINDT